MLTDFHDKELFLSELDVDALLGSKYGISIDSKSIAMSIREKKNAGKQIPSKAQVASFMESTEGVDWRQYTNGHDWLKATEKWLNVRLKKTLSYKIDIRPYLESVFSAGDFMRTELYAEIRKREENIGKNLLKVAA